MRSENALGIETVSKNANQCFFNSQFSQYYRLIVSNFSYFPTHCAHHHQSGLFHYICDQSNSVIKILKASSLPWKKSHNFSRGLQGSSQLVLLISGQWPLSPDTLTTHWNWKPSVLFFRSWPCGSLVWNQLQPCYSLQANLHTSFLISA